MILIKQKLEKLAYRSILKQMLLQLGRRQRFFRKLEFRHLARQAHLVNNIVYNLHVIFMSAHFRPEMLFVGNEKVGIDRPVIKPVQIASKHGNYQYHRDAECSNIVKNIL